MSPRTSIVINTFNRASSLEVTLLSLCYQDFPDFEVIVVNGPSTDNTGEVLERWKGKIKAGSCAEANLSISRNIGIAMAAGDIVAFIDDDAIPEPEWLSRIVAGYDSEEIGGVGGLTYNHTGYSFQSKYIILDRFCGARLENKVNPTELYNFPYAQEYSILLGTNCSFRRDLLLQIGGFDEEYEYFGDEVDVCVRIIDSGYVIKYVDDAFLHHKFLPSHIRNQNRVITRWYPVIKNKSYFAAKNAQNGYAPEEIHRQVMRFIEFERGGLRWAVDQKHIPAEELEIFEKTAEVAVKDGLEKGFDPSRKLLLRQVLKEHRQPYGQFPTISSSGDRLTVCFLSQDFPPAHNGGIARFTHDLAYGLARRGHNVHVLTRSEIHDMVDFEDGVWVHRLTPREFENPDIPAGNAASRRISDYSKTVFEEIKRIESHHHIDVIEGPIWDSECLQCILDEGFNHRTAVSLETTLKIIAEGYESWRADLDIQYAITLEQLVLEKARHFHAISRAIVQSINGRYDQELPESKIGYVPLGLRDQRKDYPVKAGGADLTVFFVGRLEHRKGIDILLAVIPRILERHPHVRFIIAGDDTIPKIPDKSGITYKQEFLEQFRGEEFLERVIFAGRVPEDELYQHYAECDIFVAPSRYESFGLIFLEAMMFGKPVVGCNAGGMTEIIEEGANGFLVEPGNERALENALSRLIDDTSLRESFGARSRKLFEERFTDEIMVDNIEAFYRTVAKTQCGTAGSA